MKLVRGRFVHLAGFGVRRSFRVRPQGDRHVEREVDRGKSSDIAAIAYTSGTTGRSKGALLTHANMISTAEIFMSVEPLRQGDNWLCYLPMGWVGDMVYSLATSMAAGSPRSCGRPWPNRGTSQRAAT